MKTYFPILKYILLGLEFFFIANFICLWNIGDFTEKEDAANKIIIFLMTQNGIAFVVLGAISFFIWRKQEDKKRDAPFQSFIITTDAGKRIREVFLEGRKSLCFVKKSGKDFVCEETGEHNPKDLVYAVLNLYEGNWYIEAVTEQHPIGLRRGDETTIYRLKTAIPYRLCPSDILYIGSNKILVKESNHNGLEG